MKGAENIIATAPTVKLSVKSPRLNPSASLTGLNNMLIEFMAMPMLANDRLKQPATIHQP